MAFTVDIRTIDDVGREAIISELSNQMHSICDRRSVSCLMERKVHFLTMFFLFSPLTTCWLFNDSSSV